MEKADDDRIAVNNDGNVDGTPSYPIIIIILLNVKETLFEEIFYMSVYL